MSLSSDRDVAIGSWASPDEGGKESGTGKRLTRGEVV